MLGELMRGKIGISVAGSHGKTTTTSMLATVLTSAKLDPTLVIGGKVDLLGGNAKLGQGQLVIAEADESDGSFLHLPATYGVITNIDNDHMDHFGNIQAIEDAFVEFERKLPFYGLAVVCGEDPGVRRCLNRFTKPYLTYGFSDEWDLFASDIEVIGMGASLKVFSQRPDSKKPVLLGTAKIQVPGRHNILNALAAIGVALRLKIPFDIIAQGLQEFRGVRRRFEIKYLDEIRKRIIIDDYGHHPTEISATLLAARQYWPGRIISVFQPHRYSRTLHCKEGFLSAFLSSDLVMVADIYPAGEDPIAGVHSVFLVKEMQKGAQDGQKIIYSGSIENSAKLLQQVFKDGDLVLCLGAGSITKLADQLAAEQTGTTQENHYLQEGLTSQKVPVSLV
jgi:UDP-N-acetylmuramate--alanine ligase